MRLFLRWFFWADCFPEFCFDFYAHFFGHLCNIFVLIAALIAVLITYYKQTIIMDNYHNNEQLYQKRGFPLFSPWRFDFKNVRYGARALR